MKLPPLRRGPLESHTPPYHRHGKAKEKEEEGKRTAGTRPIVAKKLDICLTVVLNHPGCSAYGRELILTRDYETAAAKDCTGYPRVYYCNELVTGGIDYAISSRRQHSLRGPPRCLKQWSGDISFYREDWRSRPSPWADRIRSDCNSYQCDHYGGNSVHVPLNATCTGRNNQCFLA